MKINFITSAFDGGFTAPFIQQLRPLIPENGRLAFVASAFDGYEKTEKYARIFRQRFADKGICFTDVTVVDYTITPEEARTAIGEADVVWLCGGDTLKQIAHIREYGLIPVLRERDGVTIGMSAGSINMAKRVVLARDRGDNIPELSIYEGIGLVDCCVEPHCNSAGPAHWQEILEASCHARIFCLYDDSFLVERDGTIQIFGRCDTALNGKLTAACGNDCGACPRHLPKSREELEKTAVLWKELGYRNRVVTPEEIACRGCSAENECRYGTASCAAEHRVSTCGDCGEYPCARLRACFFATERFRDACRCSGRWEELGPAFFEKERNLREVSGK